VHYRFIPVDVGPFQGKRLGWCPKSSCVTSKWADQ
jgi:hypothetical protein